jgi:RNA polymerase sigma factor (TIGR02999 family)
MAGMPEESAEPLARESIATLIEAADRGDAVAREALFTRLYAELHRVAERQLRRMAHPNLTLGATTVLHEFYLDLSAREAPGFPDRARFLGYAARAMRGLIIDYVRERRAQKRGGLYHLTALDTLVAEHVPNAPEDVARLGDAIEALARVDPRLAELVDLKFFCGLDFAEISALRGVSERTVQRDWQRARVFLYGALVDAE